MINIPDNVTVYFDENGRSFEDTLEQILKILINRAGEGEADCDRRK